MHYSAGPAGTQSSDLVEIARRNGDFRRNYGTLIGALLYLRSLSAAAAVARCRPSLWAGSCLAAALSTAISLTVRVCWRWPS